MSVLLNKQKHAINYGLDEIHKKPEVTWICRCDGL